MSGNNEAIMKAAMRDFCKKQYDILEKKLIKYCERLLTKAVDARLTASSTGKGHNFTGNLINSIVVGLYREGNLVMFITPDAQAIDRPIMKKMSYPFKYYFSETHKKSRGGRKALGVDWDQTHPSSFYSPELKTNLLYGNTDAKRFIHSYNPPKNAVFQIVVGYTTEYASFVESKRHTTGYMQMVEWVNMNTEKAIQ